MEIAGACCRNVNGFNEVDTVSKSRILVSPERNNPDMNDISAPKSAELLLQSVTDHAI